MTINTREQLDIYSVEVEIARLQDAKRSVITECFSCGEHFVLTGSVPQRSLCSAKCVEDMAAHDAWMRACPPWTRRTP